MKKTVLLITALILAASALFGGCGNKENIVRDGKTVNVRIYKAGYGTSYIEALKTQFETTFAEEGYKINILPAQADLVSTNVLQDVYSKSGVDLYFTSGIAVEQAVTGEYGQTFVDITDTVYKKNPIKFDKTEEEVTVESKLEGLVYDNVYEGKYYGLPYALGYSGLAVNTSVLNYFAETYGAEADLPKTTNELFAWADLMMEHVGEEGIFPFVYSTSGNNYPSGMFRLWMAQYGGLEEYQKFWSMTEEDGSDMELPYEVYGADSIEKMLECMFRAFDYNVAPRGTSNDFKWAQRALMIGDAAFYSVGDWMFNEQFTDNAGQRNDVDFIKMPVISSLGTKLFGGEPYNLSDAQCEEVLLYIIDGYDRGDDLAMIKQGADEEFGMNFAEEAIEEVCSARALVGNSSETALAYISVNAGEEERAIAETFLRFCASSDAGRLIARNTLTSNPFCRDALKDSEYQWIRSVNAITEDQRNISLVSKAAGYRKELGLNTFSPYTGDFLASTVLAKQVTIYDTATLIKEGDISQYAAAAASLAEEIYQKNKEQWDAGLWRPL